MDELFDRTLYWACDYLSILGLTLIHVSKTSIKNYGMQVLIYALTAIAFNKAAVGFMSYVCDYIL